MQKCEFLKQEIRVSENIGQGLPMSNGVESVEKVGRKLVEAYTKLAREGSFISRAHESKVKSFFEGTIGMSMPSYEDFEAMKTEDLTLPNNTALYTTVVRNIVERAFRPVLVANEIIRTISVDAKGMSDLKVPISTLKTASSLPTTGVLADPTGGNYDSETITLGWIYSYEVITLQTIQQGIIDIVQDQMLEIGYALSRKVDSDIITAVETASPSTGANSNYKALLSTVTYSDVVDGIMNAQANYALPDAIVTNPLTWANFLKSSNVITALGYNSVEKGSLFPRMQDFLGLKIIITPQATAYNMYIIDTQRCKYLIEASAVQMLDGRKSGTVNWEVIGLKLYGVKVIQPEAVYRLVEAGGSPSA